MDSFHRWLERVYLTVWGSVIVKPSTERKALGLKISSLDLVTVGWIFDTS